MKPITYSTESTIPVPASRVFELISDPTRMAAWLPAAKAVELEGEGPLRMGSKLRVIYEGRDTEIEVIDFNPNKVFGWIERSGRRHWKTFFRLDFAGTSTQITVQQVWTPPSLLALLKVRVQPNRNVPARLNMIVQNLRLEATK
jgi:uncharacterized protein YndB with AHSA1/START domain